MFCLFVFYYYYLNMLKTSGKFCAILCEKNTSRTASHRLASQFVDDGESHGFKWSSESYKLISSINKVYFQTSNFSSEVKFTFWANLSFNLTSDDIWPWYMIFGYMNIKRVPYCRPIHKLSLVPIGLFMSPLSHFQPILSDLRWPLTFMCDPWPHQHMRVSILYHISDPTLVPIGLQLLK